MSPDRRIIISHQGAPEGGNGGAWGGFWVEGGGSNVLMLKTIWKDK